MYRVGRSYHGVKVGRWGWLMVFRNGVRMKDRRRILAYAGRKT